MAIDLEKMRVVIEANTSDFKKKAEEVQKEAHKAADAADKELGRIGGKGGNKIKDLIGRIKATVNVAKSLGTAIKLDAGIIKETDQFKALKQQIDASADAIEHYKRFREQAIAKGAPTDNWDDLLAVEESRYADLMQRHDDMVVSGAGFESAGIMSFGEKVRAVMGVARQATGQFFAGFQEGLAATHPGLARFTGAFGKITSVIGKVGTVAGKTAFAGVRRLASGIRSMFNAHNTGRQGLLSGLTRLIAGLYIARRVLNAVVSGIKQGMTNLAGYSSTTNNSLSMLKSSLTQCKNALATAFAPILNVVAPLLNTLINWVTAAATALAHFFAALTGQKQTAVAVKVNENFASSAGAAAGAANDAADAAEKYQRTLMGFDKINKLEDKSGSGGSGGSGGGGGGLTPADMFETVDVNPSALNWAEKFKEAWANADFTEIGSIVGAKIKEALENIPWEGIQEVAFKIGKSIATFLNGVLETPGLFTVVGETVAQALNTALTSLNSFATYFHWDSLGKAISDSINGFFGGGGFNFKLAADTISKFIIGFETMFTSAISGVDWYGIGEKIVNFIASVDWINMLVGAANLLSSIATGFYDLIQGAFKAAVDKLSGWIKTGKIWDDLFKVGSAVIDLSFNIIGGAVDTLKLLAGGAVKLTLDIVQGAWKGVSDFLAIIKTKSGATVKKVLATAKGKWNGATEWLKMKASTAKKTLKVVGSKALSAAAKLWDKFKNTTAKLTATFKDAFSAGIKRAWNGIARGLNAAISVINKIPGVKIGSVPYLAKGGQYANGSWRPVAAAGGGSFNQGQMFIAREAGPELVGTIGGHTSVMNNDQIVASVSDGVAKAVAAVMSQMDGKQPIVLQGDAAKFFKAMQVEASSYTRATGKAAFPV